MVSLGPSTTVGGLVSGLLRRRWPLPHATNAGFLRSSKSPFAAPMMLIPKKTSGQWRIVFDFRALNAITVKDRHSIPRSQELFDSLYGSRVYSTFDLQDGHYHMRIREEDIAKLAVTTPFGHYAWEVMPMG
eukprot:scaffold570_cov401-Pavlova_lutheri.AAC.4